MIFDSTSFSKINHSCKKLNRYGYEGIIVMFFYLLLTGYHPQALSFEHPGGLHSRSLIETVRAKIVIGEEPWQTSYTALIVQADENLLRTPDPVEDFNVPGYYDDPEGHRKTMGRLSLDAWTAYVCAIAYQLSSDSVGIPYATKALEVLNAWAVINKQTSNHDGDLAMTDAGVGLVLAAELMAEYAGWKSSQKQTFIDWLNQVYLVSCNKIIHRTNNWGDWGVVGRIAAHYFLDAENQLEADIELIKEKIDKEIEADGSMPLETAR